MATNTLIQYLEGTDSAGTALDGTQMHRRQTETFLAGGAIAKGDWVQLDTGKTHAERVLYVIEATAGFANGNALVVGVALGAASAGEKVRVVVSGYAEGASVANAVAAAGVPLVVDNTQAGQAVGMANTDVAPACGVSLEAASGNLADVFVFKQF